MAYQYQLQENSMDIDMPFVLFQTGSLWCLSGSRPCRTMQWYQDRNVRR